MIPLLLSSKSFLGEGNGNPLQCSCLENPRDWGASWAAVYRVAQSGTQLNDFTFTFHFHALEKGNGNPLQCAYLENPRDWGASWAAVYGVTQNQTRLKRLSSSRVHKASELLLRVTPSYFSSSNSDYRVVYECVSHLVMSDPL